MLKARLITCTLLATRFLTGRGVILPEDAACALAFHGNQEVQLIKQGNPFDFVLAFTLESWLAVSADTTTFFGGEVGSEMCVHGFASMGAGPRLSVFPSYTAGPCSTAGACPLGVYAFSAPSMPASSDYMCHTPVPDEKWHHVAATWDNTTAKLYVDGVEKCSYNPPSSKIDLNIARNSVLSRHAYSVGAFPDHYRFFKGVIDEVRLWSVARTASELRSWMNKHLDATQTTGLQVELRFDECQGEVTKNFSPLKSSDLIEGSIGIQTGDIAGVGSAPTWIASGASLFGAAGKKMVDIGSNEKDIPVRAFDTSTSSILTMSGLQISVQANQTVSVGGLSVQPAASGLRADYGYDANFYEGGEILSAQRVYSSSFQAPYTVTYGGQTASGSLKIKRKTNRRPQVGAAGGGLGFFQGAYAGNLDFKLKHRGTKGISGAGNSSKLTIEFWSKNSLMGLQDAGNAGTAIFTLGNSENAHEAWCPATCELDQGCHGRGSGHMPWSAGFPHTFFHFGTTHNPMSFQKPCRWAHHSGEWQHVAFVADPDTGFHGIYFNGELCNPGSVVDGPTDDLDTFFLGVWPIMRSAADTVHHTGDVDEMRIWNVARTAQEIRDGMFRPPTEREISSGNLMASWSFDDCGSGASPVCKDASGNGHDLLFAVCGLFDDVVFEGFIGPNGPKKAPCLNLTYPTEAHSRSWPKRFESSAIVAGPFAPVRPTSPTDEAARRISSLVVTAVDPDMEDKLRLEFVSVPSDIGEVYAAGSSTRITNGSIVTMSPSRLLVHSVTLTIENLKQTKGTIGTLLVRAIDKSGAISDSVQVSIKAFMADTGQEYSSRLGKVMPCAKGTFAEGNGQPCKPCPTGKYGPLPLTWQDPAGNGECLECEAGKFGFESGLDHCPLCEAGRFSNSSGASSCENCGRGAYSNVLGASACSQCLGGMTTASEGSSANSSCICPKDHFLPCSKDGFSNLTSCALGLTPLEDCKICTEGISCNGGSASCPTGFACPAGMIHAQPLLKLGYYHDGTDIDSIFKCSVASACPGQAVLNDPICTPYAQDINCGRCETGRYRSVSGGNSECVSCDAASWWLVMPTLILIWVLSGAILFGRNRLLGTASKPVVPQYTHDAVVPVDADKSDSRAVGNLFASAHAGQAPIQMAFGINGDGSQPKDYTVLFGQAVTFFQFIATCANFTIEYPPAIEEILIVAKSLLLDFGIGAWNIPCMFNDSFESTYVARTLFPLLVWVLMASWYAIYVVSGRRFWWMSGAHVCNLIGLFSLLLSVSILSTTVSALECYKNPNDINTLRRYPSIICGESRQVGMAVFAAMAILLYLVGFSAYCAYHLAVAPKKHIILEFRQRIDFLVYKYHPSAYAFGLFSTARSAALVMITVAFPVGAYLHFTFSALVILASLLMHLRYLPYRSFLANRLETMGLVCILSILIFGIAHSGQKASEEGVMTPWAEVLSVLVFAVYMFCLSLGLGKAVFDVCHPVRTKIEHQLRADEAYTRIAYAASLILNDKERSEIMFRQAFSHDLKMTQNVADFIMLEFDGWGPKRAHKRLPMQTVELREGSDEVLKEAHAASLKELRLKLEETSRTDERDAR
eukprot:TRINITY_DN22339_c0_g1_i1.p1 TRINITY_DN22339_c0_g1~~TRINITY_DN22339_c0_g1_i1.p1  ORF type:complete len:1614 (-),score=174.09 TRINITY_DN22339_c0_g1_i1:56-4825(-)